MEGLSLSTGAMAASTFGTLSFPVIAPFVRESFELTTVEIGMFTALVFFGAMIASVPAGRMTDRLGAPDRRPPRSRATRGYGEGRSAPL